jgi:pantoate--beta-alanine ligase
MTSPHITRTIEATRETIGRARGKGQTIGLVPTMGALHAGHLSLIQAARREAGFVVVSIFVNPSQFGPHEDLSRYPRPFEQDAALCAREGVDLIFHPEPAVMYPPDFGTWVEVHDLQDRWEGATRPGHFRGVATIVLKLFNIVQPDVAYFGQKDAQQARILEQMVGDLNVPVAIKVLPTVREPDGLALSSRNQYLTAEQRGHATVLFRALEEVRKRVAQGERQAAVLTKVVEEMIAQTPGARLDYVAFVDHRSLRRIDRLEGKVLVPIAVFMGTTRLIDNLVLDL